MLSKCLVKKAHIQDKIIPGLLELIKEIQLCYVMFHKITIEIKEKVCNLPNRVQNHL